MSYYEFSEEYEQEYNSLRYEFKILLSKYFHGDYIDFEDCYNCERHLFPLTNDYKSINKLVRNKINNLIEYRNIKKGEILDKFKKIIKEMKILQIEPDDDFELTYHVARYADRAGRGYTITPYLSKEVAENTTSSEQQEWTGKYGSTHLNNIVSCGGHVKLDCNYEKPKKSFGLAINCDHY